MIDLEPLVFNLGELELPDGTMAEVAARVVIAVTVDGLPRGRHGLFTEFALQDVLRRLLRQLADPAAWQTALGDDD